MELWSKTDSSSTTQATLFMNERDSFDLTLDWAYGGTALSIRLTREELFALRNAADIGLQMGS